MKEQLAKIVFLFRRILFRINRLCKIWNLKRNMEYEGRISENIANLFEVEVKEGDNPDCFHVCILGQKYNLKAVNWSEDAGSSFVYDKVRFDKLHYARLFGKGIEVKNPWELSRFQFFHHFILQYLKTKDLKYYEEFKNLIYGWCADNPFLYGVNWTCTMEVSIRAINWVFACSLFGKLFFEDEKFKTFLRNRLIDHARYIYNFPERGLNGTANNHLAADYCGLFVISMFIRSKEADKWRKEAIVGLEGCMEEQILNDGCDFECSIPYHRLILEILLIPAFLDSEGRMFSNNYFFTLCKMLEFVECYTDIAGNAPQMGDNDSGVILPFNRLDNQNHLYLLSLGGCLFDHDFMRNKQERPMSLYIQPVRQKKMNLETLGYKPRTFNHLTVFPQGGYYILKEGDFDLVVYSPLLRESGHRHYDTGNFTLSYKGRRVLLDPGTGCYTPDFCLRSKLKGEASHNVYYQETDGAFSKLVFESDLKYQSVVEETCENGITIKVRYFLQDIYIREFRIDENGVVITDQFLEDNDRFKGGLNFSEDVQVSDNKFCSSGLFVELEGIKNWRVRDYDYSPVYGKIEKRQRIEYSPCAKVKIVMYV